MPSCTKGTAGQHSTRSSRQPCRRLTCSLREPVCARPVWARTRVTTITAAIGICAPYSTSLMGVAWDRCSVVRHAQNKIGGVCCMAMASVHGIMQASAL